MGSFRLDLSYFNFHKGLTMTSRRFHQLFEGSPRDPETEITQRVMDLAASVQSVVEDILLKMAQHLHHKTGLENLCVAGGLGLNCVANGQLRRKSPFQNIWVQPAAGDAGGALGAALFVWHQLLGNNKIQAASSSTGLPVYTGPAFSQHQIESAIQSTGLTDSPQIEKLSFHDNHSLCEKVSELLAQEKVVGWFKGRMEFGRVPWATAASSPIHGVPKCKIASTTKLNSASHFGHSRRLSWHPGPIVFFDIPVHFESPYMLFAEKLKPIPQTAHAAQSESNHSLPLPAITHVNQSARLQTVTREQNDNLAQLLETFEVKTAVPSCSIRVSMFADNRLPVPPPTRLPFFRPRHSTRWYWKTAC